MTEQEYQEYQDQIDDKCDACDRDGCSGYIQCPYCNWPHNECEACE